MNVKVEIYLAYEEDQTHFSDLINSLTDVLSTYGYANVDGEDEEAKSLLVVKRNEETDVTELVKDSFLVVIPVEQENEVA